MADPSNPFVTRRELDDLLREELAAIRRETNDAIRELRDDLHTVAQLIAAEGDDTQAHLHPHFRHR